MPVKPVRSLSSLAVSFVHSSLQDLLEKHCSTCTLDHRTREGHLCAYLSELRSYIFKNISSDASEDIIAEFQSYESPCISGIHSCMIILLFAKNMRKLKVPRYCCKAHESYWSPGEHWKDVQSNTVLHTIALHGSNMLKLDIRNCQQCDDVGLFARALDALPKLENLKFTCRNGDLFLGAIGEKCRNLVKLDISNVFKISESGIRKLCFSGSGDEGSERNVVCETLRIVCLGIYEIRFSVVTMLLENITNLQSLGKYGYADVVVERAVREKKNFSRNLTCIRSLIMDANALQCLIDNCENIKELHLPSLNTETVQNLHLLDKVTCLKIFGQDFNNGFTGYLEKHGSKLEILSLDFAMNVNFDELDTFCPNLRDFCCGLKGSSHISTVARFQNLEKLEFDGPSMNHPKFIDLLARMSGIQSLYVRSCEKFTDADIRYILLRNAWKKLEKLLLEKATKLSPESVFAIMEGCPQLVSFGYINAFNTGEMSQSETLALYQGYIKRCNLDLKLRLESAEQRITIVS